MRKSKNEIEKTVGRSAGFVVSLTFFAAALFEKFLFFLDQAVSLSSKSLHPLHSGLKSQKMSQLNLDKLRFFRFIIRIL